VLLLQMKLSLLFYPGKRISQCLIMGHVSVMIPSQDVGKVIACVLGRVSEHSDRDEMVSTEQTCLSG